MSKRVLIVGGVAGGASTAARLRRLDEEAEIVIFERGPHVSFANCGLPYYVGDIIADEADLLVASRELFRDRFNIEVRVEHEVLAINREKQTLRVRNLRENTERDERYDALVLSPGAAPIIPKGADLPGVFVMRTIPDAEKIRGWIEAAPRRQAVVVGGGFIGLEMAENLHGRGLPVTLLEKLPQVMPPLDPEMATLIAEHLRERGVTLRLGEGFSSVTSINDRLRVATDAGKVIETDLVILALGVRPETKLAREAGLGIGERGGITVDRQMRTSDHKIYAVGDAVEVHDVVGGKDLLLALAGPANRQGRIAAEAIAGRDSRFRGVQGTAIVGVMSLAAAMTGLSEKSLRRQGVTDFEVVYLHPGHHASYYPGAQPLHLKLLFARDGRVLGAQAVGSEGVDKRIDVIAAMIQMGGTVHDLAEAELCYAPQFGSAKDPLNMAGMMAENVLAGDMTLADWATLPKTQALVLDVRSPKEFADGHIAGAHPIPLPELRRRLSELPHGREIWIYCGSGQRSYFAQRLLRQHGYEAKNLSGGYQTFKAMTAAGLFAAVPEGKLR